MLQLLAKRIGDRPDLVGAGNMLKSISSRLSALRKKMIITLMYRRDFVVFGDFALSVKFFSRVSVHFMRQIAIADSGEAGNSESD